MLTRIITSIVGLIIFFAVLFSPPIVLGIALTGITLGMIYELYTSLKCSKPIWVIGMITTAAILIGGLFTNNILPFVVGSAMLFLILTVLLHGKENHKEITSTAFITILIAVFMQYIYRTYLDFSKFGFLLIFICAWMTDTGAYFAGVSLGKHKLIPRVSPKKTVEGSIGGILICVIACVIYLLITKKIGGEIHHLASVGVFGYVKIAAIGLIGSVMSQFGDLFASAIKRDCGVKDFGKIFPGHGGLLDRFDSVLYISPLIYYLITYIG